MKTFVLLSSLMLFNAASSFAAGVNPASLNTTVHSLAVMTPMDYLQAETQDIQISQSSQMTRMVLQKLNAVPPASADLLERLQQETQEISLARPVFILAAAIKKHIEKHYTKETATVTR